MFTKVALSISLLACGNAVGQGLQLIGIDSRIANIMAHRQNGDELCWAASAQMILNYYRVPISQEEILQNVHGNVQNRPGTDQDITAALNGWGVPGSNLVTRTVSREGLPAPSVLIDELTHGRPILITFSSDPNSGHAIVITGAAIAHTNNGVIIRSLIVRDPWPSPDHVATSGRVQYDDFNLALFAPTVRRHWLTSLVPPSEAQFPAEDGPTGKKNRLAPGVGHPADESDAAAMDRLDSNDMSGLLRRVISLARSTRLSSIRGGRDPDAAGDYLAKITLPGAQACSVLSADGMRGGYSYQCRFVFDGVEDGEALRDEIADVLEQIPDATHTHSTDGLHHAFRFGSSCRARLYLSHSANKVRLYLEVETALQ